MADRLGRLDGAQSRKGYHVPVAIPLFPVERRRPLPRLRLGPAVGEPQLGPPVAAVRHECQILAVGYEPVRKLERLEENAMPRRLVVERETIAVVSDPMHAFGKRQPA